MKTSYKGDSNREEVRSKIFSDLYIDYRNQYVLQQQQQKLKFLWGQ
jgi:hypothetical protein